MKSCWLRPSPSPWQPKQNQGEKEFWLVDNVQISYKSFILSVSCWDRKLSELTRSPASGWSLRQQQQQITVLLSRSAPPIGLFWTSLVQQVSWRPENKQNSVDGISILLVRSQWCQRFKVFILSCCQTNVTWWTKLIRVSACFNYLVSKPKNKIFPIRFY